jgi:hypothetical protein
MAMTNAEKQARHRARVKEQLARLGQLGPLAQLAVGASEINELLRLRNQEAEREAVRLRNQGLEVALANAQAEIAALKRPTSKKALTDDERITRLKKSNANLRTEMETMRNRFFKAIEAWKMNHKTMAAIAKCLSNRESSQAERDEALLLFNAFRDDAKRAKS